MKCMKCGKGPVDYRNINFPDISYVVLTFALGKMRLSDDTETLYPATIHPACTTVFILCRDCVNGLDKHIQEYVE